MNDMQIGFSLLRSAREWEMKIVADNIDELKNNTYQQASEKGLITKERDVLLFKSFTAYQRLRRMAIAFDALIAMADD